MARKNPNLIDHPHLFIMESHSEGSRPPNVQTWADIENNPAERLKALAGGNIGPHVDIVERAERLVMVMNALAHRNMLKGFDVAVNDRRYKKPIWTRYLDVTPVVTRLSQSKTERLEDEAADHFWRAMGFETLRGTGILSTGEVKSRSAKMWRDFNDDYGSPKVHDSLVRFRKEQKKLLPKNHPLRAKNKKAPKTLQERAA